MKDPDSFTIPCTIGKYEFKKALCDSGASINLMPLSVVQRLSLGEITPTSITLQMADRLMAQLEGVLEDVLVKVGKFIFLVDFVVMKMEKDTQIPLLLGRPFLVTAAALIDVQKGANPESGKLSSALQPQQKLNYGAPFPARPAWVDPNRVRDATKITPSLKIISLRKRLQN